MLRPPVVLGHSSTSGVSLPTNLAGGDKILERRETRSQHVITIASNRASAKTTGRTDIFHAQPRP